MARREQKPIKRKSADADIAGGGTPPKKNKKSTASSKDQDPPRQKCLSDTPDYDKKKLDEPSPETVKLQLQLEKDIKARNEAEKKKAERDFERGKPVGDDESEDGENEQVVEQGEQGEQDDQEEELEEYKRDEEFLNPDKEDVIKRTLNGKERGRLHHRTGDGLRKKEVTDSTASPSPKTTRTKAAPATQNAPKSKQVVKKTDAKKGKLATKASKVQNATEKPKSTSAKPQVDNSKPAKPKPSTNALNDAPKRELRHTTARAKHYNKFKSEPEEEEKPRRRRPKSRQAYLDKMGVEDLNEEIQATLTWRGDAGVMEEFHLFAKDVFDTIRKLKGRQNQKISLEASRRVNKILKTMKGTMGKTGAEVVDLDSAPDIEVPNIELIDASSSSEHVKIAEPGQSSGENNTVTSGDPATPERPTQQSDQTPSPAKMSGYTMLTRIGGGSFGSVFRGLGPGTEKNLRRAVVIKTSRRVVGVGAKMQPKHTEVGRALKTLQNKTDGKGIPPYLKLAFKTHWKKDYEEIKLLRKLKHSNIIECLAHGFWRGALVCVMPLRNGSMAQLMESNKAGLPTYRDAYTFHRDEYSANGSTDFAKWKQRSRALWLYFTQILSAFEYIHQQGIVHLDVKPENILWNASFDKTMDEVDIESLVFYITDFGMAERENGFIFSDEGVIGTYFTSPPENYIGGKHPPFGDGGFATTLSDIWSLYKICWIYLYPRQWDVYFRGDNGKNWEYGRSDPTGIPQRHYTSLDVLKPWHQMIAREVDSRITCTEALAQCTRQNDFSGHVPEWAKYGFVPGVKSPNPGQAKNSPIPFDGGLNFDADERLLEWNDDGRGNRVLIKVDVAGVPVGATLSEHEGGEQQEKKNQDRNDGHNKSGNGGQRKNQKKAGGQVENRQAGEASNDKDSDEQQFYSAQSAA